MIRVCVCLAAVLVSLASAAACPPVVVSSVQVQAAPVYSQAVAVQGVAVQAVDVCHVAPVAVSGFAVQAVQPVVVQQTPVVVQSFAVQHVAPVAVQAVAVGHCGEVVGASPRRIVRQRTFQGPRVFRQRTVIR